ncbi:PRD domain-containing protein [Salipaludibacillus agaradhaerens]|uniref:PRD domain-containing protein n=1 Tax=Salipaludibacillus agaradhaerens TaxID=76935 RepID=UPI002150CC11|nr:PRD domain-containing protein [Salipaludibacillus agaradhaerens]MCR6107501.1 PRD domain-containing protein [Salipaludibacillus agaradhaerens]MCR6119530.1 PRD domain-containing protein [Salipaludibacillus agaradhaerens]
MVRGPFYVHKALNNNVVVAESGDNKEVIFIGKGIGFGKKKGDIFEEKTYDKVYSLVDEVEQEKYLRLATKESEETLLIIHEAIEKIHEAIGFRLGEQIHSALTQHLALALQRTRDQTDIKNPFLTETKWLYHDTYLIAQKIVDFIDKKTGYKLPEAEVGFITLHIQSAIRDSDSVINKESDLITRCIKYIEEKTDIVYNKDTVSFRKLIHHLKNMIRDPMTVDSQALEQNIILMLKEKDPVCYNISRNLVRMIEKSTTVSFSDSEVLHLMLYIRTLIEKNNKP